MGPGSLVTVLAGGWSAGRRDVHRLPGHVIGVNDAGLLARCDAIVSMDRLWTEHRWSRLTAMKLPSWIRRSALQNIPPGYPSWISRFDCDHASTTFSAELGTLNGTHSGACALNLAYQLRPETVSLVGFDFGVGPKGEAHWYAPYPWAPQGATGRGKFAEWRRQMADALAQFQAAGISVEWEGVQQFA